MNTILRTMWPYYNHAIGQQVLEQANPIIAEQLKPVRTTPAACASILHILTLQAGQVQKNPMLTCATTQSTDPSCSSAPALQHCSIVKQHQTCKVQRVRFQPSQSTGYDPCDEIWVRLVSNDDGMQSLVCQMTMECRACCIRGP